jgi:hypothetical protein
MQVQSSKLVSGGFFLKPLKRLTLSKLSPTTSQKRGVNEIFRTTRSVLVF